MILDILLLAFFLLFLIIGIKRGAARTLLNLTGMVLASFLSSSLGSMLAKWIYENGFKQGILDSFSGALEKSGAADAVQTVLDSLPPQLTGFLSVFGVNKESLINDSQSAMNNASKSAAEAVEGVIGSAVTSVISFFVIILLFFLLLILFKMLIRLVVHAFELPVLRQLNGILGGILGAAEGVIFLFLLIMLIQLLMPVVSLPWLTPELIEQSNLFKFLYHLDIFSQAGAVLHG